MEVVGFSEIARDLIYRNITGIGHSFFINGEAVGNIKSFRGVRQGDPLAPLLFVLAQQVFSTNLKREIVASRMVEYKVGRGELSISRLFLCGRCVDFYQRLSKVIE